MKKIRKSSRTWWPETSYTGTIRRGKAYTPGRNAMGAGNSALGQANLATVEQYRCSNLPTQRRRPATRYNLRAPAGRLTRDLQMEKPFYAQASASSSFQKHSMAYISPVRGRWPSRSPPNPPFVASDLNLEQ